MASFFRDSNFLTLLRNLAQNQNRLNYKYIRKSTGIINNSWSQKRYQQTQVQSAENAKLFVHERITNLKVGNRLSGFVIKVIQPVPEFQLVAIKLHHEATGGEYLHISRDDTNNAFSVGFRTTPTDSTGLPHILEHTTLCGSHRYPCRDPFFKMLNRSLATFMNAMTGPDYTMYPFSTQNCKDFQNLMSVYLDAVFRPNLRETDFQQEGWRLEHSDPKDPDSPIIFKGVVFNEMKGVFADNQNIFSQALQSFLLPTHTYSVCSGGDPLIIPTLTYSDLKNFHEKYYSPPNTKYYSYGSFPFEEHLNLINEEYLKCAKGDRTLKAMTEVPSEQRWTEPVRKHISCREDPMAAEKSKQSCIAISYLCSEITDVDENFLLLVLSELLVGGPNSSFYKTLIEPKIGAGFSPTTGYESHTRDTFFSVGLQGVNDKDFDKIIEICDETFDNVIRDGFKQEHIEAILHSIELNTKHQTSNFGLALLFSLTPLWNHDGDIIKLLQIEERVKNFKANLKRDPNYLQKKVKRYFKDNKHKLILTMSPDAKYDQILKDREDKLLKEKLEGLTDEGKKIIYENGLKLLNEQKKDDKACLPTLKTEDLNKDIEYVNYQYKTIQGVPFQIVQQPTNGITYFRALLPTGHLNQQEKSLLPLFSMIATKMGTNKHNFKDFDQIATLKTSGLTMKNHLIEDITDLDRSEQTLLISSYCLDRNVRDMFGLWSELFQEYNFKDVQRFETLVKSEAADLVNSVAFSGHHYAMLSSSSLLSASGAFQERAGGLTFVDTVKKAAQGDPEQYLAQLIALCQKVMTRRHFRCALNVFENNSLDKILGEASDFINTLSGEAQGRVLPEKSETPIAGESKALFHVLPFPVSFAAKSLLSVPYKHDDFASLRILTRLISMKYLHPEIREKGGAYGGGASLSMSGIINFYSYRDPNPANSLQTYDNTCNWLKSAKITDEDVNEARLGVFQNIDAPVPPGNKGMTQFLSGVSDQEFQRHRQKLMRVNKDDLYRVCDKYLNETNNKLVSRAIIGQENKSIINDSPHVWKVVTSG